MVIRRQGGEPVSTESLFNEELDVNLGRRNRICGLLAVAALSVSATASAQAPAPPATSDTPPQTPPQTPAESTAGQSGPPAQPAPPPGMPAAPSPAPPLAQPALSTTTFPSMQGPALKLSDLFTFRPGIQLQIWAQAAQDPVPKANGDAGGYSKNFYARRARFFVGGAIGTNITYLLLWESANNGLATANADGTVSKNFASFVFNDAFLDFKINKYISVQAGLFILPFTRQILQSTASYVSIDIAAVSAAIIGATQTQVLRDTGVEIKVNGADNHFEARLMATQGVKLPDGAGRTPGKNDPRLTGFLQYNFLDSETGYVFNGLYYGKKKIANLSVGADYQDLVGTNPYFALSATAFAAIPVHGGDAKKGDDELNLQVEYLHYHAGRIVPVTALGKQNDLLVEGGYYNRDAKFSVFGKFEGRFFDADTTFAQGGKLLPLDLNNTRLYAGGVKYFFAEQIANLTLQYNYMQFPNQPSTVRNSTNTLQLQFQLAYF
jgi:hypothetical protein